MRANLHVVGEGVHKHASTQAGCTLSAKLSRNKHALSQRAHLPPLSLPPTASAQAASLQVACLQPLPLSCAALAVAVLDWHRHATMRTMQSRPYPVGAWHAWHARMLAAELCKALAALAASAAAPASAPPCTAAERAATLCDCAQRRAINARPACHQRPHRRSQSITSRQCSTSDAHGRGQVQNPHSALT